MSSAFLKKVRMFPFGFPFGCCFVEPDFFGFVLPLPIVGRVRGLTLVMVEGRGAAFDPGGEGGRPTEGATYAVGGL